jgi:hypothetical protein
LAGGITPETPIDDAETVYRRVRPNSKHWKQLDDGTLAISQNAFHDQHKEPSVDRALLRSAEDSREGKANGLLRLRVGAVRAIASHHPAADKPDSKKYCADVVAKPVEGNAAHCVVIFDPEPRNRALEKLQEALARLASWEVTPGS